MSLRGWMAIGLAVIASALCAQGIPMGVVEGFYGDPWSHRARLDMIEFLGDHELDLYIYAPKADPGHRRDWRSPYDEESMAQFRELVQACQENGIELCFAMSPGNDMVYSDPEERATLLDKMMCLQPDGVTHFALFLDDIDVERMGEADQSRFSSAVEAQMYLANRLNEEILAREPNAWFLICPTVYRGVEPTEYWDTLREQLEPGIEVVWTGPEVISPTITDADLDAITEQLGRPPFIWDNYPVNDFQRSNLFMGPLVGRTPDLVNRISGYAANPMNEAYASMIPLVTIADFVHNPEHYDPEASWQRAIAEVAGREADDVRVFSENSLVSRLNSEESPALNPLLTAYLSNPNFESFTGLNAGIREIIDATDRLPVELDTRLERDLDSHIEALGERALAMKLALLFAEDYLTADSTQPLLRLVDRARTSGLSIGDLASERLFSYAVGLNPHDHGPFAPSRRINAIDPPLEGRFPGSRGSGDLNIYTPAYGHETTGTNPHGLEVTVEDGVVTAIEGNDSPIPANGYVISGHGGSQRWIENVLSVGMPLVIEGEVIRLGDVPEDLLTPDLIIRIMQSETAQVIADLVEAEASNDALRRARASYSRAERLKATGASISRADLVAFRAELAAIPAD